MSKIARLVSLARPIRDHELPRMRRQRTLGARFASALLFFIAGGPPYLVIDLLFGAPDLVRDLIACAVTTTLAIALTVAAWSRHGERFAETIVFASLCVALIAAPLQAWASPLSVEPMVALVVALPPLMPLCLPMRPSMVALAELPAFASLVASESVLAGALWIPEPTLVFAAAAAAAVGAAGAQTLRRHAAELERAKEQLQSAGRLAYLGMLSAGIAHELKTPIGAVRSSVASLDHGLQELAESIGHPDVTDDDLREIVGEMRADSARISAAATRAGDFVRSVRSHAATGRGNARAFAVGDRLVQVLALLAHQLRRSGVRVDVEGVDSDLTVHGQPEKLDQILTNLIGNAVESCASGGGGLVRVTARMDGSEALIAVEDDGPGVADELRANLFQPLVTGRPDGVGLGLSISREIAVAHFGGSLELRGRSRFELRCPVDPSASGLARRSSLLRAAAAVC